MCFIIRLFEVTTIALVSQRSIHTGELLKFFYLFERSPIEEVLKDRNFCRSRCEMNKIVTITKNFLEKPKLRQNKIKQSDNKRI